MVLAISYDNDGATVFALGAETLDTRVDGIAYSSSLDRTDSVEILPRNILADT